MTKFSTTAYLAQLNINVMHFGLEAITGLLTDLGNPEESFPSILIAGTNGKGSTAAMTASILARAGYKTGLYTSPHLVDIRERIVVNGKKIAEGAFNKIGSVIAKKVTQPVTYFEFLTAAAFCYFEQRQVDIAVMEVGLGGRLDATNVCRPLVSVITNIALDHTAYLGNSLKSIAEEKAGIIKQDGICITGAKQKRVLKVLEDACRNRKARLYQVGKEIKIIRQEDGLFKYRGEHREIADLSIALAGSHQCDNAALALAAIECIENSGFKISDSAIRAGLRNTHWDARMEILQRNPLFLLDGAHNPAGITALCRALKNDFSYRRLILIFGAFADKDYPKMLKKIAPLAYKIILAPLQSERAASVDDLSKIIKTMKKTPVIAENFREAINIARHLASEKDLICAAGSLYLAGVIKQAFPDTVSCDKKRKTK
jgi:dihydrofolate synthase/folylpolyglutamate synthase